MNLYKSHEVMGKNKLVNLSRSLTNKFEKRKSSLKRMKEGTKAR